MAAAAITMGVTMSDKSGDGLSQEEAARKAEADRKRLDEMRSQMVAIKIKEERTFKKMSQDDVADAAGLKRWNVGDVEQNRSMALPTLWRICDAMEINLSVILSRVDRAIKEREEERRLGLVSDPESDA